MDVIVGMSESRFFPFNLAFIKLYINLQSFGIENDAEIKHDLHLLNEKRGTN